MVRRRTTYLVTLLIGVGFAFPLVAQDASTGLDATLKSFEIAELVESAQEEGDPERGALVFFTSAASCSKCHISGKNESAPPLGPDLARLGNRVTYEHVIESILYPSRKIHPGYETVIVETARGEQVGGLLVTDEPDGITLRDLTAVDRTITIERPQIEAKFTKAESIMPTGLASSLRNERDFFDLVSYVFEVAHGGPELAAELRPSRYEAVVRDDSGGLDHAGILRSLGDEDLDAGQQIYGSHCKNCHGSDGNKPTMPVARAFGTQQLKFGSDPYRMFLTLTRGNGLMSPMSHLSAKERYQVVHYVRQNFMKPHNPDYAELDEAYLESLPRGSDKGEFKIEGDRDFGAVLASQIGDEVNNALSFRLPDDVTLSYDLHRMRIAAVWQGDFLDLSRTHHYRLRGEHMPEINGTPIPGLHAWQWQFDGSFEIPADAKPTRGPIRKDWLNYRGHYLHDDQAILSYEIHGRHVLETIQAAEEGDLFTITHTLRVDRGTRSLLLSVGQLEDGEGPAGLIRRGQNSPRRRRGSARGHVALVSNDEGELIVAALGDVSGMSWSIDEEDRIVLTIPAYAAPRVLKIVRSYSTDDEHFDQFMDYVSAVGRRKQIVDPLEMTEGGPPRWPERLNVSGTIGKPKNGYALDTIPVPFDNPWNAWLRTSALDFFDDGRAVVTTYGGDVYIVDGLDDGLEEVTWQRAVAGLFEPLGVRILDNQIYVTCHDGIKRLHDFDQNGEIDFVEAFWVDDDVSSVYHSFNFDLQTDSHGNFFLAKCGQHTNHGRPGSIMRIPPEGGTAEVFAWGLRTPNGMGTLNADRLTVSDNQGRWIPAGKISLIRPGAFLGSMPDNEQQEDWLRARHGGEVPTTFDDPIIWLPQEVDNSCGGQLWVADRRWGPLSGRLIHSSYGKGRVFYLSLQEVGERTQGAIVALPHQWDAGVMRLRVNPHDGQVYGTGPSGWQGPPNGKEGCLQRLRYAGNTSRILENVQVFNKEIRLTFNFAVDPETARHPEAYAVKMWNYLWSERYGSNDFSVLRPGTTGRDDLKVEAVVLEEDQRTVKLLLPDLETCDQVQLQMDFQDAAGDAFSEQVHLTVHAMPSSL